MVMASLSPYNVFCVAQSGRLEYEAEIFVASFRAADPDFAVRLVGSVASGA